MAAVFDRFDQKLSNSENFDTVQEYDVIIVGAGFSGISALHRLRKAGLQAHIFEAGSDFGGVWYWNRYPGARVDSEMPFYQLNIPEVYNTWNFSQRYPDHVELQKYLRHIDKTLGLSRDVSFNARVNGCTWDAGASKWKVRMETGVTACAQFLILATGLLHRAYVPTWPGQEKYCGVMLHSGAWPEDTDVSGKHVAIIGAGSTSVQITQELGKTAAQLTVLLRRPSYCLPMGQRAYTDVEQDELRAYYPALFAAGRKSFTGLPMERQDARAQDVSAEERERYFESTWKIGGFHFLLRGYNNVMLDKEANKIVYDYWRKKTLKRLTDVKKQEIMAPGVMPYYFSTKRSPLEQDYYEVLNQDNVEVVDLNEHPIKSFTEWGMQLGGEDGGREFDYIICATGYDSYTGSVTNMGLISKDGVGLKEVWKDGVRTHLGMTIHGFPNAFMVYSPQAPTALANGPTIIECQCDIIVDTIINMRAERLDSIEATREAEDEWKASMNAVWTRTLYPHTDSWWNTANIPGKKAENQNYILGIGTYEAQCRDKLDGWKGFDVVPGAAGER